MRGEHTLKKGGEGAEDSKKWHANKQCNGMQGFGRKDDQFDRDQKHKLGGVFPFGGPNGFKLPQRRNKLRLNVLEAARRMQSRNLPDRPATSSDRWQEKQAIDIEESKTQKERETIA